MTLKLAALGLGAWLAASPALAHHSYAMFDIGRADMVTGTLKQVEWANPHVWLEVAVPGPKGVATDYSFEGGAIANLKRAGWTRDIIKPGDIIVVNAHPFKSGQKGGSMISVTTSDGKVLQGAGGVPQATVQLPPS